MVSPWGTLSATMVVGWGLNSVVTLSARLPAVTAANATATPRPASAGKGAAGSVNAHHQTRYGAKNAKYVPLASRMNTRGRKTIGPRISEKSALPRDATTVIAPRSTPAPAANMTTV